MFPLDRTHYFDENIMFLGKGYTFLSRFQKYTHFLKISELYPFGIYQVFWKVGIFQNGDIPRKTCAPGVMMGPALWNALLSPLGPGQ